MENMQQLNINNKLMIRPFALDNDDFPHKLCNNYDMDSKSRGAKLGAEFDNFVTTNRFAIMS